MGVYSARGALEIYDILEFAKVIRDKKEKPVIIIITGGLDGIRPTNAIYKQNSPSFYELKDNKTNEYQRR